MQYTMANTPSTRPRASWRHTLKAKLSTKTAKRGCRRRRIADVGENVCEHVCIYLWKSMRYHEPQEQSVPAMYTCTMAATSLPFSPVRLYRYGLSCPAGIVACVACRVSLSLKHCLLKQSWMPNACMHARMHACIFISNGLCKILSKETMTECSSI